MANFIPEEILEDIQSRCDIVEVINGYIPLKRAGSNFKALCPFHNERTPSFIVSPSKQIYHCFGCFPAGSLVKTINGFHNIEDICEGDLVLTHRARHMPVIRSLWRFYNGEVVRIFVRKSNLPVVLTADHEVFVIGARNCKYKSREGRICQWGCKLNCGVKIFNNYKLEKVKAKDLCLGNYLLFPINQKINDIKYIELDKYYTRKENRFGPKIKPIPTKIMMDEKFLKIIGYWIAEGSNHRAYIRFSLGGNEREFAEEIADLIESIFHVKSSIHVCSGNSKKSGIEVTACNSKLANIFENLCGRGAENKHIPFEFQELPPSKQRIILEAIFKGDGGLKNVSKSKNNRKHRYITTISPILAEQLRDVLLRFGVPPTIYVKGGRIDKIGVRHRPSYIVIWQDNYKLKFSRFVDYDDVRYYISPIRKILREEFQGDVYNLTVAEDHSYSTPNFVVGNCGAGGNIFGFIMQYERLDFVDAVKLLADRVGVVIPEKKLPKGEAGTKDLWEVNKSACELFHKWLLSPGIGKAAYNYLKGRDIKDEIIKKFMLGYAPGGNELLKELGKKGFSEPSLIKAGLVVRSENTAVDMFRDRLMFPIFNAIGKVVGFSGRVLDNGLPKYINTPETPLFHKGKVLYGLHVSKPEIIKEGEVVICEGYFDFLRAYQWGLHNIVASQGTAFTIDHVHLLRRYASKIIVSFDADSAGDKAALRGLEMFLSEGLQVKVLELPKGHDPDSFVKEKGINEFRNLIQGAKDILDTKLNRLCNEYPITTTDGKLKIIGEILPDINNIRNEIYKRQFVKQVATRLSVPEESIWIELRRFKKPSATQAQQVARPGFTTEKIFAKSSESAGERQLVQVLMDDAPLPDEVLDGSVIGQMRHSGYKTLLELIIKLKKANRWKGPNSLMAYIKEEGLWNLVSKLAAEEISQGLDKGRIIRDCIYDIKRRHKEDRIKNIIAQIEEREKNKQDVSDLVAEMNNLRREPIFK